ncbi:MAG: hypothetical protein PHG34_02950 [Candidatus Cloacimonetes bacterium]|nr:hypothetical protein [Candidatus Cloacimonadota bacterium]
MKKNVILLTLSLCMFLLWGQNSLSEYSFSYSVSTYQEITDGISLGSETTDDEYFVNPENTSGGPTTVGPGFPIGFDFHFAGHSFDKVGINANGWISLGDSSTGPNAVNMKSTSEYTPLASVKAIAPDEVLVARIAGFTRNLQAQAGSSIRIKQQGIEPSRELIVQWKNYRRLGSTGDSFNFQICLKEQGMQVCTRYQLMQTSISCTGQIGLRAAPAAFATNFANRTSTITQEWAYTQTGAAANEDVALTSTNYPEPGATFTWSPAMAVPGPNIYIQMQGNDAVISWDPINTDGNGFIPEYYDLYCNDCSTASDDFSLLVRVPYPQTTYIHSGVGLTEPRMMYRVKAVRLSD